MEDVEQQPPEPRKGLSRHLTEEGALPICEQCNSGGLRGRCRFPSTATDRPGSGSARYGSTSPLEKADCRDVYICDECFWAIQQKAYGGVDPWFEGWEGLCQRLRL